MKTRISITLERDEVIEILEAYIRKGRDLGRMIDTSVASAILHFDEEDLPEGLMWDKAGDDHIIVSSSGSRALWLGLDGTIYGGLQSRPDIAHLIDILRKKNGK